MPQPAQTNTYAVKVTPEVSVSTFMIVTASNKPWVTSRGDLILGDDLPTPVVIPERCWMVVYAVDPETYTPLNVVFPALERLPQGLK